MSGRLTPDERDSLILTAIVNAAEVLGRPVTPWIPHDGAMRASPGIPFGTSAESGPCCAVGAGVLYAGVRGLEEDLACVAFAEHYNVSLDYALGVSDGFETALNYDLGSRWTVDSPRGRGFQVGKAAFEILHGGGQ